MCAGNVEQGDISLKCTNQRANYDQHKCISTRSTSRHKKTIHKHRIRHRSRMNSLHSQHELIIYLNLCFPNSCQSVHPIVRFSMASNHPVMPQLFSDPFVRNLFPAQSHHPNGHRSASPLKWRLLVVAGVVATSFMSVGCVCVCLCA